MLDDSYSGAEPKLDAHQMSELEGYLEEYILPDAKSVIAHIDKQYGVHYSVSGVTDLLHRLGFSYKKPTHVSCKQDPAQQQAFLDEYEQIKANKDENDPIYFADATHPQHNSIPFLRMDQERAGKRTQSQLWPSAANTPDAVKASVIRTNALILFVILILSYRYGQLTA